LTDATITVIGSMERAGRVLAKLKLSSHGVTDEQLAVAAWPAAVGKTIASRCLATKLVRSRLVVEVPDPTWQKQLWTLRTQVLGRLETVLGSRYVEELEFRVVPPRRQPARAESVTQLPLDDADGIRDPLMRNLYKEARKKATA
jgi:hypothetical protein